jgi:hypothetical protein
MHNFDDYYSHCDDNLLGNQKIDIDNLCDPQEDL